MTKDNSSYGRKPFPEKRGSPGLASPCYASSSLKIERDLWSFEDWTPDAVTERRRELVNWASERWSVKATAPRLPSEEELDDYEDYPSEGAWNFD